MRCPAAHRLQRTFAALLWVLASFAFIVRQQEMNAPSMSGMPMGADVRQTAPLAEMHMADMPVADMSMTQMNAPAEDVGQPSAHSEGANAHHQPAGHDANAPPTTQNHAGHCPFCFTAAFALSASAVNFLASGHIQTAYQLAYTPSGPRSLLGNKRARAPPLVS